MTKKMQNIEESIFSEGLNDHISISDGMLRLDKKYKNLRIDIGLSENAPQSENWLSNRDDLFVIGFEPNPFSCQKIRTGDSNWPTKLSENNQSKILLVNAGLGSSMNESLNFYVTEPDPGQSSFLLPADISVEKIINIDLLTLDEFSGLIDWEQFPYVEYIKVDCQGYDLEVLKGASNILKDRTIFCTAEAAASQYINETNQLTDLVKFMNNIGFMYINPRRNLLASLRHRKLRKYVQTDDPTFINRKFINQFLISPFEITQIG